MTTVRAIQEEARQNVMADGKFWRSYIYFFELIVPGSAIENTASKTVSFMFPLMLNPHGIQMSEPFALTQSPGVDGGLVVEENGIVFRTIKIDGTTGFKPRPLNVNLGFNTIKQGSNPSFKPRGKLTPGALSGQKHLQALQDRVFRTYGDLKRDPATSRDTHLVFHNIKDDEHWEVKPRSFTLTRNAKRTTLYDYSIDLLVVGPAEASVLPITEDKSTLDMIKDGIAAVRSAIELGTSAVKELLSIINEIENVVSGALGVVRDVLGFFDTVGQLINGAASFIAAPINQVANLIDRTAATIDALAAAPFIAADQVLSSFRKLEDSLHQFMLHPELFEDSTQALLRKLKNKQEVSTKNSAESLRRSATTSYSTLAELAQSGSALSPGAENQASSELGGGRSFKSFNSLQEHVLTTSDSLSSLAARYLGDARQWQVLAVVNNLQPPYLSTVGLPNTRRPGDTLLVPSQLSSPRTVAGGTILGTRVTDSAAARALGTDLALGPSTNNPQLYDVIIDDERGRVDAKTVSGVPNLIQACQMRLLIERGSDILYRNLGLENSIGLNIPEVDAEMLRLRVAQALLADPRIASVTRIELSSPSPDTVEVDMDATVAGLTGSVQTRVQVAQTY